MNKNDALIECLKKAITQLKLAEACSDSMEGLMHLGVYATHIAKYKAILSAPDKPNGKGQKVNIKANE